MWRWRCWGAARPQGPAAAGPWPRSAAGRAVPTATGTCGGTEGAEHCRAVPAVPHKASFAEGWDARSASDYWGFSAGPGEGRLPAELGTGLEADLSDLTAGEGQHRAPLGSAGTASPFFNC